MLPLLLVFFVFVVLFTPETSLSISVSERIIGLLLLDFAWGVHHFAAQHYGILRLYHHCYNPQSAASAEKQDRIFCWGVGGGGFVWAFAYALRIPPGVGMNFCWVQRVEATEWVSL